MIQLGRGILDKPNATIEAVTLEGFEGGRTAEVVEHGRSNLFTGYHPPADELWKVIERAEFLLKLQPKLRYNLIGHNCEIMANMCAVGGWTESYQVRAAFGLKGYGSAAFMIWLAGRSRAKLPLPGWVAPVAVISVLVGLAAIGTYNYQIRRFWFEIRDDWLVHERMVNEDPRNGTA